MALGEIDRRSTAAGPPPPPLPPCDAGPHPIADHKVTTIIASTSTTTGHTAAAVSFAYVPGPAAPAAADTRPHPSPPSARLRSRPRSSGGHSHNSNSSGSWRSPGVVQWARLPSTRRRSLSSSTPSSATTATVAPNAAVVHHHHPLPSARLDDPKMEVQVVPSVVLHFHGFRSSLLASLWDACVLIACDLAKWTTIAAAVAGIAFVALQLLHLAMIGLSWVLAHVAIAYGTYAFLGLVTRHQQRGSSWPSLAKDLLAPNDPTVNTPPSASVIAHQTQPTLPRLDIATHQPTVSTRRSNPQGASNAHQTKLDRAAAASTPVHGTSAVDSRPFIRPPGQLPLLRRRILEQQRRPAVIANPVRGERRQRSDVSLFESKIRVGKAFLNPTAPRAKPQDVYMVRVDCSQPDDKHMNPVVMWDFTASFEEFRRLEKNLRGEVKHKRLRHAAVPHLSSGAMLFVQPELTQDVLATRRRRLQTFLDGIIQHRVLADLENTRKFCQAQ